MTARVYRCPRFGNIAVSHDYGLKNLVYTKCEAPLRDFEQR